MKVQFDEQQSYQRKTPQLETGLTGLVIKLGLAKDQKQASMILLGVIVVSGIIATFSVMSLSNSSAEDIRNLSPDPDLLIEP